MGEGDDDDDDDDAIQPDGSISEATSGTGGCADSVHHGHALNIQFHHLANYTATTKTQVLQ